MKTNKKHTPLSTNTSFLKIFFVALAITCFMSNTAQAQWTSSLSGTTLTTDHKIINIGKSTDANSLFRMAGSGGTVVIENIGGEAKFSTSSTKNIILATSKVGIGVAAPTEKLDVAGNIKASNAMISSSGDWAFFSHKDMKSNGNQSALFQHSDGRTYLGSASGKVLALRNAGADKLVIDGANSTFNNTLKVAAIGGVGASGGCHFLAGSTVLGTDKPVTGAVLTVDGRVYISENAGTERGFTNLQHSNYKDYLLWVEEGIVTTDVAIAALSQWPDYVFNKDYKLNTLKEVDTFIKTNGHLPTMPSAKEVEEKGFTLTDMTKRTVKTVEELTLHTIEQQKLIDNQAKVIESLVARLTVLEEKNK